MQMKQYDSIRLRDEIAGSLLDHEAIEQSTIKRTMNRDKVAKYIITDVVDKGRWPVNMTDLAEEVDFSRQLVSEVVNDYFVGVDDTENRDPMPTNKDNPMTASPDMGQQHETVTDGNPPDSFFVMVDGNFQEVEINVPDDVENRSTYIRGYLDGRQA